MSVVGPDRQPLDLPRTGMDPFWKAVDRHYTAAERKRRRRRTKDRCDPLDREATGDRPASGTEAAGDRPGEGITPDAAGHTAGDAATDAASEASPPRRRRLSVDQHWRMLAMLALRENAGWPLDRIGRVFGHDRGHISRCLRQIKRELRQALGMEPSLSHRTQSRQPPVDDADDE